jgi:hypothetical protein
LESLSARQATAIQLAQKRIPAALCAGAIAIGVNVIALWGADLVHIQTAHGGLLKLLLQLTGVRAPDSAAFSIVFHVMVGLAMAVVYGLLLEPLWRWSPWSLGLAYAIAVWIANAFVVLPLIDEGIAGSATLSTAGILWFAAAHTFFSLPYPFSIRGWDSRLDKRMARQSSFSQSS